MWQVENTKKIISRRIGLNVRSEISDVLSLVVGFVVLKGYEISV